jgi:7-cyano-7-deazaguanine synthase in queuosine biosynthesis
MDKGILKFKDGTELNLDYAFPSSLKTVAMSMSGGVESSALFLLLEKFYGKENLYVFSADIDRRSWEAEKAYEICKYLSLDLNRFNKIQDNDFETNLKNKNLTLKLRNKARQNLTFDGWFCGANKLLFSKTKIITEEQKKGVRNDKIYLPFIDLLKHHTIEIFFLLQREDVLERTHSCTVNHFTKGQCGKCYCCHERMRGFASLGKEDPAKYNISREEILENCFYSDKYIVKNW